LRRGAVFLDTSAWLAALSTREDRHAECAKEFDELVGTRTPVITTNLVIAEMHGLLVRRRGAVHGLTLLDLVHDDPSYEVIHADRALEARATDDWLRRFSDTPLSLTDAVSFQVMREGGLHDAFTLDQHFEVVGYRMIPRR